MVYFDIAGKILLSTSLGIKDELINPPKDFDASGCGCKYLSAPV